VPCDSWSSCSRILGITDQPKPLSSGPIDACWWWVLFARDVAAVAGQQIVSDPALLAGGRVAQQGLGAAVSGEVTEVLGALVV